MQTRGYHTSANQFKVKSLEDEKSLETNEFKIIDNF